jgi:hypothetical protein
VLRARLAAPPPHPLPIVLFLPSANQSARVADLVHPDRIERSLIEELDRSRELVLRQLALLRRQDRPTADRWIVAVTQLADTIAATKGEEQHYDDTKAGVNAETDAIATRIGLLIETEALKDLLRKAEIVRDRLEPTVAIASGPITSDTSSNRGVIGVVTAGAAPLILFGIALLRRSRRSGSWRRPQVRGAGAGAGATHASALHHIQEMRMTRDELLTQLSDLLPSQFEMVLFRARIPMEHLSSVSAPQATRAIEAIRYFEQQNELPQLAGIVQEVVAANPP